jgi:excisionase family DNA binding protein
MGEGGVVRPGAGSRLSSRALRKAEARQAAAVVYEETPPVAGRQDMSGLRVVEVERRAFFSPKTLAEYLALSERTIREMLRRGDIPSYRVADGARRIDPADVDSYLAKRREEAA